MYCKVCLILTQDGAEVPDVLGVELGESWRHADEHDEQVGNAQVQQEHVGRVPHVPVPQHDVHHQRVAWR